MPRLVCDTNVLISGILTPGAPRLILARLEARRDVCFTSERLLVELERVLIYPRIERGLRKAGLHWHDVLNWVIDHTQLVIVRPLQECVVVDDRADDEVLACALAAQAEFVVSGDDHLLRLHMWRGIPLLPPRQYLDRVGESASG